MRAAAAAAVGEFVVEQCKSLRGDDGNIPPSAGQRRVTHVESRHQWRQQASLGVLIQAASSLFIGG
ncbi:MAG UNVERIFIED_CONTAM: hypothetical protein LVR18_22310 [Planctomycetaceae bacterium]